MAVVVARAADLLDVEELAAPRQGVQVVAAVCRRVRSRGRKAERGAVEAQAHAIGWMPAVVGGVVVELGHTGGGVGDDRHAVEAHVGPGDAVGGDDGGLLLPQLLAEVVQIGDFQEHLPAVAGRVNS